LWDRNVARSLYSSIIGGRPSDDPGSIPEKDVIDVVAYLLQEIGLPAGDKPIEKPDELNNITLGKPK
jgi:hypothetical protein